MAGVDETTENLNQSFEMLVSQFEAVINKIKKKENLAAAKAPTTATPSTSAAGDCEASQKNARQQKQQLSGLLQHYFQHEHQTMRVPQRSQLDEQEQNTMHHLTLQLPQKNWQLGQQHCRMQFVNRPLVGGDTRVQMEPSELRLILKLETSITENGSLVVRPSVRVDGSTFATESHPLTMASDGEQVLGNDSTEAKVGYGFGPSLKQQQQQQKPVLALSEQIKYSFTLPSFDEGRQINNHHDDVESDSVSFCYDSCSDCSDAEEKSW